MGTASTKEVVTISKPTYLCEDVTELSISVQILNGILGLLTDTLTEETFVNSITEFGAAISIPAEYDNYLDYFLYAHAHLFPKTVMNLTRIGNFGYNFPSAKLKEVCFVPSKAALIGFNYKSQPIVVVRRFKHIYFCCCEGDATILHGLLDKIISYRDEHKNVLNETHLYSLDFKDEDLWVHSSTLPTKELSSVFMRTGVKKTILDDIESFNSNKDFYRKLGILPKRCYLFYGPPGSGKTSLIRALASHFGKNVYSIFLEKDMKNSAFQAGIAKVPQNAIVIFEDIDRMSIKSSNLATLLSVLDGTYFKYPMLMFLTTNHRDKLDAAILRRGRVDMEIFFPPASKEVVREGYEYIFHNKDNAQLLSDAFDDSKEVSMSAIIELFVRNIHNPFSDILNSINDISEKKAPESKSKPKKGTFWSSKMV